MCSVEKVMKKAREKMINLAKEKPSEFIERMVKIEDKTTNTIVEFKLWKEQKEALLSIDENKKNVILKARQLGFSWLCLAYAVTKMIANEGYRVLCFSQGETEAKEMIRRVGQVVLPNMESLIGDGGIAEYVALKETVKIKFPDGRESVMQAMPSTGRGGKSFSADLIIFDEWAEHPFAEMLFGSAYPTINRPGGKFIGLSTMVKGTFFEEVVVNFEDKGFNRIFIPWYADPRRDAVWYEETRRTMGERILWEYPATVEEALTVPGGAFFPEFDTRVHVVTPTDENVRKKRIYYQSIDYGLDMLSIKWISVDENGRCRVFREFDKPDLIISEAAREISRFWEEDGKPKAVFAPPDMWNRETGSGKSRFDIFRENGVVLTKSSNDLAAGCAALKEMLYYEAGEVPKMVFERDKTAVATYTISKIQRDKKRCDVYAKEPHDLTHSVDALRYFAVMYTQKSPKEIVKNTAAMHYRMQMKNKRRFATTEIR